MGETPDWVDAMERSAPRPDVLKARRDFFDRGAEPEGLSPAILRSWHRCAERGFDSHGDPSVEPVGSSALRELHERSDELIRHCRPELESLAEKARDTAGLVILTDASGFVLDAFGDPGFAGKAAGVALRPGAKWAEASTGTNAIGTALVERRPIEVRGPEHYFEPHRILSCAAAPIFDPRGAMIGALDLSGHAGAPQMQALALLKAGIDQIEHRMFAEGFGDRRVVRFHADPTLIGTPQEGVLAFEGARLVAANRHALRLLDLDWNALGARSFGDLFDGRPGQDGGRLQARSGATLYVRPPARPAVAPGAALTPPAPQRPPPPAAPTPVFDAATQANLARAVRLVDGDVPILIQGETGSGKEIFARTIHAIGTRATKPFVAVNCAAIPESLIEAELFGYEPGAFTGARKSGSKGLLREAEGGVLFLDEIGDMPLTLQARLLRVVQDRSVMPLGGGRPTPLDIRLICATHRDLTALSASEAFRADLYFRLAQFTFALPPFRELARKSEAIEALWAGMAREDRMLAPETVAAMARHRWPGNHREIVGVMKAMIALSEPGETLGPDLLPATLSGAAHCAVPQKAETFDGELDALTRSAMLSAIEACDGNVSAAAKRLGVSRSTLYRRAVARRA